MQRDDIACLKHILDAAGKAVSFVQGKTRKDLKPDEMLALSLVRLLEIVEKLQTAFPQLFETNSPTSHGEK
jgi:uncharacterized protein with HEPN domain